MNFEINRNTLVMLFTLLGLLFFTGIINFIYRSLTGGTGGEAALVDAAGSPLKKLVGLFLLLVCLFYSIRYQLLITPVFIKRNIWIIVFVFYVFLSFLWSVDSATTIRRSIFLASLVFFAAYLTRLYSIERIYTFIGFLIATTALIGLFRAVISPSDAFITGGGGLRDGAFLGMYIDKNGGARSYVIGITLLLPAIFSNDRKALIAASLCLLCLLMSRSASAMLLLVIAVGTYLYLNRLVISSIPSINKRSYLAGMVMYFVALFLAYQAYEFIFSLVGRDATLTNRTVIWELLRPLIQEKIALGYGYGAFWASFGADEFIKRWSYIGNAHNGYLEMLLHGGIPMLVIFTIMAVKGFLGSIHNASYVVYSKEYNVSIALIIMLLISNFIAYSLPNHNSFDFFVFMIVLFLANKRANKRPNYD
ncbi:MAG: O-antigen ligase family protein [Saccharospirillaceae bacterium]|nr:O-antigen ligase family protein [Saccharospirillaceae bacterium]